jgi:hypothetical protein
MRRYLPSLEGVAFCAFGLIFSFLGISGVLG